MSRYHIWISILQVTCIFLMCVLVLGITSPSTFAQVSSEEEIYDTILEVKRDRNTLTQAIFGLEKNGKYYLPLQEIARIVKFKVDISLENETANGFFILEKNSFSLDLKNNQYSVRDKTESFSPDNAFVFKQELGIGDIYVAPELINKIWPLQLNIDPLKQVLKIQTNRKLPYELSEARSQKRSNRLNRRQQNDNVLKDLPNVKNNYKLFSLPALDFSSTTRIDGDEDGLGQSFNVRGRHDLLKAQADYSFSFDKEPGKEAEFQNARFLLERKSFDKKDMPLGLQLAQIGDIRPRPSRLIDGSLRGRGLLLSTEPQKIIRDFDQIVVEGIAEPGWEVELYRGNELIGFQIVDDQGEYRFEDVTLNYSNTVIKTILYGPEGQIREEEQTYNIASSMLKPGKTIVEASLLDLNRDLFVTSNRPKNNPEGFAQNIKVKRGINSWLSAFATYTGTPTRQKNRQYTSIGANFTFLGMSGLGEVYKDLSGGTAYDLRLAGNYNGTSINFRNAIFSGFESEEAKFDGAARESQTELSLARSVRSFIGNLGFRFRFDHERFKTNPDRTEFDLTQTYFNNGLRLTHGNSVNLTDRSHQNTDGRLSATYRLTPKWQLRSLLNYDFFPDRRLRNLLAEIRYRDGNKFTTAFDINRSFMDQSTRLGAQMSYDFEKFRTGVNFDWDKDTGLRAFLRATFSMAPYGQDGGYIFSSKNLSNKAAYNSRIFLDENDNGEFDSTEKIIEDAKVDIGRRETGLSDDSGLATFIGSTRNDYENISLNLESLQNPFYITKKQGYSTVLRPGTLSTMDFPVIETGLIDGTIIGVNGPLAGVRMQLLSEGKIIDTTSSAFDGFYTFEYVEPGSYIVQVDPSYEQINIPPRHVSVTSKNLFQTGIGFRLFEQAAEVTCANEDSEGIVTQNCQSSLAQAGILQPVHTNSLFNPDLPTVKKVHFIQKETTLRMVFDLDKPFNNYKVIEANRGKEISIILTQANWDTETHWINQNTKILKKYMVEKMPSGDVRIILIPVDNITMKAHDKLTSKDANTYSIYFDLQTKPR